MQQHPGTKKIKRIPWLLMGFVFSLLIGCGGKEGTGKSQVAPIPVEVAQVEAGPITEYIQATGRIEPFVRVQMATKLQGRVEEVNFQEGDRVTEGQVLVRIDARDVLAQKGQAEASLAESRASLKQLSASQREAQARLKNAETSRKRLQSLFDRNSIAEEKYDDAVTAAEVAKAQLDGLIAQGSVIEANEAMARAKILEASTLLDYATLRAPFTGIVTQKNVETGGMSAPGVPLVVLEDQSKVKVELIVPEKDIASIRQGMDVEIQLDALPGQTFQGQVEMVIPSGDPLSYAFVIKAVLDNPDRQLKAGMFVRAGIVRAHEKHAIKVPKDAILEEGEQEFVYRIEKGSAFRVNIRPGLRDLKEVQVAEGLSTGDEVVTRGKENLTNQSPVRVVNQDRESVR